MQQLFMNTAPSTVLAFEMPDDSMYPRISKADFAVLSQRITDFHQEIGEEVLLNVKGVGWLLRTVANCSDATVMLSAYNHVATLVPRCDIGEAHRVEWIVPPTSFALMTKSDAIEAA